MRVARPFILSPPSPFIVSLSKDPPSSSMGEGWGEGDHPTPGESQQRRCGKLGGDFDRVPVHHSGSS